ncbi:hypothetical protein ACHWQZ_G008562 [Mnemiopsis leidyi]
MDDGEAGSHMPEACSTPRSNLNDGHEAPVSYVGGSGIQRSSPADSEESEADILERSIRMSSGTNLCNEDTVTEYKIQQLTHEIEPTTVFSGSIMHTAESPSQMNIDPAYFQSADQNYSPSHNPEPQLSRLFSSSSENTQFPSNQVTLDQNLQSTADGSSQQQGLKAIDVQPSAPTLQQIQSHCSVPLMDVSKFQSPQTPNQSKPSHLGRRPTLSGSYIYQTPEVHGIQNEISEEPSPDNSHHSPQEGMKITLSPITSPHTSLLLKPSIHWYYSNPGGSWNPFSYRDSEKLEKVYTSRSEGQEFDDGKLQVSTDGGRYDVNMAARQRIPVYWDGCASAIRRCTWFYRGNNDIMQPYNEDKAKILEEHYATAVKLKTFPMRVELGNGEVVIINSHTMMVQYTQQKADSEQNAPRLVKRGVPDEDKIPPDEKDDIDHLVFVVHGIGSVGDLKFRSFVDCVTDMRVTCQQLVAEHWTKINKNETSIPGRIELMPIQWHAALHSDTLGVDKHINKLTLPSIPMLRDFVNNTCVDVLFYTSPFYCETITEQCGTEMNRLYKKFLSRNPHFAGKVSIVGHSLGSVIAFDILSQQTWSQKDNEVTSSLHTSSTECMLQKRQSSETTTPDAPNSKTVDKDVSEETEVTDTDGQDATPDPLASSTHSKEHHRTRTVSRSFSYQKSKFSTSEVSGTGQPEVSPTLLSFRPEHFFALGSPLGLFLTVRGVHSLDREYSLPTCKRFYNIFHPVS